MSYKVRFWVLLAVMVLSFFGTIKSAVFSQDTFGGWFSLHLVGSFLIAGILNVVLMLVLYAKKRSDITTALLIVFAVIFFPVSIFVGAVLLVPHLVLCLVMMIKGARAGRERL